MSLKLHYCLVVTFYPIVLHYWVHFKCKQATNIYEVDLISIAQQHFVCANEYIEMLLNTYHNII